MRSEDPERSIADVEEQERLLQCMASCLDSEAQELVILRYFEQLTMGRISEIMEIPPDTLRRRHRDAMAEITRHLSGGPD